MRDDSPIMFLIPGKRIDMSRIRRRTSPTACSTIFLKGSKNTGRSLAGAHILSLSSLSPETCLGRTFLESSSTLYSEYSNSLYSGARDSLEVVRRFEQLSPSNKNYPLQRNMSYMFITSLFLGECLFWCRPWCAGRLRSCEFDMKIQRRVKYRASQYEVRLIWSEIKPYEKQKG